MIRDLLYPLTFFSSLYLYLHAAIVWWLGYPLVPETTTNEYWELLSINLEIIGLTFLFFLPATVLAGITTAAIMTVLALARLAADLAVHGWGLDDRGQTEPFWELIAIGVVFSGTLLLHGTLVEAGITIIPPSPAAGNALASLITAVIIVALVRHGLVRVLRDSVEKEGSEQ